MKTWLGLLLTVLGLSIGLGSTLLDDLALQPTQLASFMGVPLADLAAHSTVLVSLALILMIVSFFLIFANREDEIEY